MSVEHGSSSSEPVVVKIDAPHIADVHVECAAATRAQASEYIKSKLPGIVQRIRRNIMKHPIHMLFPHEYVLGTAGSAADKHCLEFRMQIGVNDFGVRRVVWGSQAWAIISALEPYPFSVHIEMEEVRAEQEYGEPSGMFSLFSNAADYNRETQTRIAPMIYVCARPISD